MAVSTTQHKSSLMRTLRVGEDVSFDNGRIVVKLEAQSGRRARLNFQINRDIQVDKPPKDPGK